MQFALLIYVPAIPNIQQLQTKQLQHANSGIQELPLAKQTAKAGRFQKLELLLLWTAWHAVYCEKLEGARQIIKAPPPQAGQLFPKFHWYLQLRQHFASIKTARGK